MTEEIIGMDDMMAVYGVTDLFGIDRESISVPLEKEGGGAVTGQADGSVEIVVPADAPVREWLPVLHAELQRLGFEPIEEEPWED